MEAMVHFHEAPDALKVLTPPPLFVQMVRDARVSLTQGEVEFILWFGPLPIRWTARHEPGPTETSFIDRLLTGPMASWEHQHIFRTVDHGVELTDKITFAHKPGWRGILTRLVFDGLPLRFLFWYRHWRTRRALEKSTLDDKRFCLLSEVFKSANDIR
jgi:ligand-binding SRPBCC domain-containing protein